MKVIVRGVVLERLSEGCGTWKSNIALGRDIQSDLVPVRVIVRGLVI